MNARPPCPSPAPEGYRNSCPSSQWCHPTISSSVLPLFFCLQSFPASGSFPRNQFFTSGQSIGVSASASVLPVSIQDWFPLGLSSWISLQPKGLSRVFSNPTVKKHQFFGAQLSLWSNCHMRTWLLEKPPNKLTKWGKWGWTAAAIVWGSCFFSLRRSHGSFVSRDPLLWGQVGFQSQCA